MNMTTETTNGVSSSGPRKLRLKYVGTADFRKTEATLIDEVKKEIGGELGKNECIILVSGGKKILKFIFAILEHEMVNSAGTAVNRITKVLPSRTYRITDGGTFHPYMLQNYANDIGIELAHLKRLEAHLRSEGVS
jgi:hypothetical protein